MWRRTLTAAVATAMATGFAAAPAQAQKSKDTLRSAFNSPIRGISYYYDPKPDTAFEQAAVYDGLVVFDEKTATMEPLLAKSWKRVSDTAIEFDLRDDVKWHDGAKFDADDVVYTYSWLTDPKTKLRFKRFWSWIGKVEKLGPYKVRITAKRPTPYDLMRHAYLTAIVPKHIHGKLKDKVKFGLHPVGTGMYKVLQVDSNAGIVMVRNPAFRHGGKGKPVSNIGRIEFKAIPDYGTQVAQYLAGNLDMVRGLSLDQAEGAAKRAHSTLTIGQSISYIYMALDAAGRSGNKALTDVRVRKALMMATNRADIESYLSGGRKLKQTGSMCWKIQAGCDYSVPLPAFDVEGAKKLMAEAGYADGFDLDITTFTTPAIQGAAEIVAGQLSKIGVRGKVDPRQIGSYRRKQAEGKIEMIVAGWPAGGFPDVSGTLGFIFASPPSRNYHGDPELVKLARRMGGIMDDTKRRALGRKVFDMATEKAYFIPLSVNPVTVVHTDDMTVDATALNAFSIDVWGLRWK